MMTKVLPPAPGCPPIVMGGESIEIPEMPMAVVKRVRIALEAWWKAPAEEKVDRAFDVVAAMLSGARPAITGADVEQAMTQREYTTWLQSSGEILVANGFVRAEPGEAPAVAGEATASTSSTS